MRKVAGELCRRACFRILERVLPVRDDLWCFCAWPGDYLHTVDNPRAVFEVVKDDPAIRKIVLVRGRPRGAPAEGRNVHFVDAESFRGVFCLARSGVVLVGYSLAAMSSYSRYLTTKHKIVQLWHGIPLKRIGRLFPPETWWDAETRRYAATVCSSPEDRRIMAAAFAPLPEERVWLTGLPRNDLVLRPEGDLPADYRRQLDDLRRRLAGRRLVLYAPTWRQSGTGIYQFSEAERQALQATMDRNGAVFGVRGHANRRASAHGEPGDGFLRLDDFPDANVVLRLADVLVTDYSSIYIDFLLTDRPVVHFTYDADDYVNERGFLYDLEEALAGPGAGTAGELVAQLDVALRCGHVDAARHAAARRLFHAHGDDSAAQVARRIRQLVSHASTEAST